MRCRHRTPATKWQWNLFYSKVIATSVNTFIPLGDETINSSIVERSRSLMDPQLHPLLHFLVRIKPTFTNVFLQVAKNYKSQRERSGLYGECWSVPQPNFWSLSLVRLAVWGWALSCKRMNPSDIIPGRFDYNSTKTCVRSEGMWLSNCTHSTCHSHPSLFT